MTKVNFYDEGEDVLLKFAVIIARYNGKWVFFDVGSTLVNESKVYEDRMKK